MLKGDDMLTPQSMRLATSPEWRPKVSKGVHIGQQEPNTKTEEIVIAQETATDDQNPVTTQPTNEQNDENRHYKYPLSIGSQYPARIIFRVIKIEGLDVFESLGLTKENFNAAIGAIGKVANASIGLTESVADETITEKEKQEIVADSKKKTSELVSYVNNEGGTPLGDITLPLMRPLKYDDMANYSSTNLGVLGAVSEEAMLGGNALSSKLGKGVLSKGLGIAAAGALLAGGGQAAAVASATRIASAPNSRTQFNDVKVRNFSFDFTMVANSPEEQKQIKNIIKMFRQELYPEKIAIGTSGVPLAYKYPNVFEIEIKNKFGSNPGFKIQRCYLQNVSTTFNEGSRGLYSDGQFVDVNVSVSFQEIVALDKQKVRLGY